ncbi:hypothetical protein [Shewanella glacialipiscicola]|uniref:Uncharacterized protein n=1 Tax=Shewanella glacialipiscicola TaxID=614069 RepID=A0ABQ6JAH8_9GAMM|nr:hypothetical protein [Shewanella glacialipiscicola]MCL1086436.1 hypothetical protein [Shewanella glacialipiscicola]GIU04042.1 hypothetical protein TUM4636_01810 [Shewanella glacialipiscicola]GMA84229.1 hypothetical protein GCM10025855_37620 [Shewanella glacialipiscicola]
MKILIVFVLIAIGVFLFRRTQRLAKKEQEALKPKSAPITPVVPREEAPISSTAEPEQVESVELAVGTPVVEAVIEVEAELMPRDPKQTVNTTHISVDIDTDIIEVDIPAAHNEEAVIILGSTFVDDPSEVAGVDVLKAEVQATVPVIGAQSPGDWANVTLKRAFEEYQAATSVSDRYSALQNMVGECYKQRKSADYLNYGAQLAQEYIALFQAVTAEQGKTAELKSAGFLHLATLLNDTQAFDAAIVLCRKALEFGLSDGTVTGFEGRISRIEKAQTKAAMT